MTKSRNTFNPQKQNGAVLLVALGLLLILTLMGVATMESSTRESKMTIAVQDNQKAFELAEWALKDGETVLSNAATMPDADGTSAWTNAMLRAQSGINSSAWWNDASATWWSNNGIAITGGDYTGMNLQSDPRYIIERYAASREGGSIAIGKGYTQFPDEIVFHRVTARATGSRPSSDVFVQSTYVKKFD